MKMKTFKFTCKQNQTTQVVNLLSKFGKPHVTIFSDRQVVTVNLPQNVSKNSVNKFLFNNNVPGATKKTNKAIVAKANNQDSILSILLSKGIIGKFVKVIIGGKFHKVRVSHTTCGDVCHCDMFDLKVK